MTEITLASRFCNKREDEYCEQLFYSRWLCCGACSEQNDAEAVIKAAGRELEHHGGSFGKNDLFPFSERYTGLFLL